MYNMFSKNTGTSELIAGDKKISGIMPTKARYHLNSKKSKEIISQINSLGKQKITMAAGGIGHMNTKEKLKMTLL